MANKESNYYNKFRDKILRLYRRRTTPTCQIIWLSGVLVTLLLLCLVVTSLVRRRHQRSNVGMNRKNFKILFSDTSPSCCVTENDQMYVVECKNLDFTRDDSNYVIQILETIQNGTEECSIKLTNSEFANQELGEKWLPWNPDQRPKITEIKIEQSNLKIIKENSFSNMPFLRKIYIISTDVRIIEYKAFNNLTKLTEFALQQNEFLEVIEEDVFRDNQLTSLQIQNVYSQKQAEMMKNLTSHGRLKTVTIFDLFDINVTKFPRDVINNMINLNMLKLEASNVESFEEGSFNELSLLKLLYLRNNNIAMLPEDTFGVLIKRGVKLFIADNPIICDCQMKWLQDENPEGDLTTVVCSGPEFNQGKLFLEADMVCATDTPSTQPGDTTTEQTDLTTVDDGIITVQVECFPSESNNTRRFPRWVSNFDHIQDVSVKENVDGESVTIRVGRRNRLESYTLLFIENSVVEADEEWRRNKTAKCLSDLSAEEIVVRDLKPSTTYTFCLSQQPSLDFSPFNCYPHTMSAPFGKRTWLDNSDRSLTIFLIVLLTLLGLILGALLLYIIVRTYPILIRGSKRVIVVKRREKAVAVILPKGYSSSSLVAAEENAGVVSTIADREDTISSVSYISAITPSPMDIYRYRLERLAEMSNERRSLEWCQPAVPPPCTSRPRLPPDVDLLFEYEWYTTTTTTTVT